MVRLWRKLGCLAAESSAPVVRLHEGIILLYSRTDPQIVKIITMSICDAITNLTDGHVSDDELQISMVER